MGAPGEGGAGGGEEAEELGAEDVGAGREHRLFLPTPPFMASAETE